MCHLYQTFVKTAIKTHHPSQSFLYTVLYPITAVCSSINTVSFIYQREVYMKWGKKIHTNTKHNCLKPRGAEKHAGEKWNKETETDGWEKDSTVTILK